MTKIALDPTEHTVCVGNRCVDLTRMECALLDCLIRHRGHVLSRKFLATHLWKRDPMDQNAIEVTICALRNKLTYRSIKTLRGIGYRFEAPAKIIKKKIERT